GNVITRAGELVFRADAQGIEVMFGREGELVAGPAQQAFSRGVIARAHEVGAGLQRGVTPVIACRERDAADGGAVDILHAVGRIVPGEQIADLVLIDGGAQFQTVALVADVRFQIARALGIEIGILRAWVIEVREGRGVETGAGRQPDRQVLTDVEVVAERAGDLVAVRADAVVAQARLQVVAPETAVPDGPRRIGVAPRDLHVGAVRGPFLGAFQVTRERLPVAQLEVVLPAITAQQGGELRIPYPVVVAFLAQAHAQHALPHRVDVVGTGEGIG